jgi:hypothetical protein
MFDESIEYTGVPMSTLFSYYMPEPLTSHAQIYQPLSSGCADHSCSSPSSRRPQAPGTHQQPQAVGAHQQPPPQQVCTSSTSARRTPAAQVPGTHQQPKCQAYTSSPSARHTPAAQVARHTPAAQSTRHARAQARGMESTQARPSADKPYA